MKYCASCGEKKRLAVRDDGGALRICTLGCAARGFMKYLQASAEWDNAYCNDCGEMQHMYECAE